ncbi:uncharacterized protein LOC108665539 [Hyalella azteca]|uniref:Uncharacterized protein LOC108665539 n=1 Tax=Hyalella azteca TaxID=294128 RepID=A0A8B7N1R9_HYAAZ|nr:uncharacterized protein LOC108665539 [Hyalella azteca]XP_047737395.1 uncharacterized protein LOC108665539 [Hyalella azteca]
MEDTQSSKNRCHELQKYKTTPHLHPKFAEQREKFYNLVKSDSLYESDWEAYWQDFLESDCTETLPLKMDMPIAPNMTKDKNGIDIDDDKIEELINDPDFLDDLDCLGDEFGSIMQDETCAGNSSIAATGKKVSDDSIEVIDEVNLKSIAGNYFIESMQMLTKMKYYFGSKSSSIEGIRDKCLNCIEGGENPFTVISKEDITFLNSIVAEIHDLSEHDQVPEAHKALLKLAGKELSRALAKPKTDSDIFFGVSIRNIAHATVGSDVARIISFIENTLIYKGLLHVSKSDIMRIFLAVRALQLKICTGSK